MSRKTAWIGALCAMVGCTDDPLVRSPNLPPSADPGPDQSVVYQGVPVDVLLDGSRSSDRDGMIIAYRWLSATRRPDGKRGRYIPAGESPDWPADYRQTMVRLPQGLWVFSLQVTDDKHATSIPKNVTIAVGVALPTAGAGGTGASAAGAQAIGSAGMGSAAGAGAGGAAGAVADAAGAGAGGAVGSFSVGVSGTGGAAGGTTGAAGGTTGAAGGTTGAAGGTTGGGGTGG